MIEAKNYFSNIKSKETRLRGALVSYEGLTNSIRAFIFFFEPVGIHLSALTRCPGGLLSGGRVNSHCCIDEQAILA
jgi:hypothetical protein